MSNYQNGKIYSIRSYSNTDLVYIGSTTQSLPKRFYGHKNKSNNCTSKQIIDIGDAYIELIEFFPCDNVYELIKQEGEIIRSMVCVNKCIAGRTPKQYYIDNKEKILLKEKQYRDNNEEKILLKNKKYYIDNKEKINKKFNCECGGMYTKSNKTNHTKTKKHKLYIENV